MKTINEKYLIIILILALILLAGCKKEEVPVITTTAVSKITAITAIGGGNISGEGSSTVTNRGVCWSTGTKPTIADNVTTNGAGAGSFSSNIVGLKGATIYFVRAYATNNDGTGYGMAMSFTTLGQSPAPYSATATNITATAATLNGTVNSNYLSTDVTFEYGTTISYGNTIIAIQSPVNGNTNVSASISGLTAVTIYHYRIKAVNSLGTTYSNDITFTTFGQVPTVSTTAATKITTVSAQLNGTVNANYLDASVIFEFGLSTSYGTSITAIQSPITGNVNASVDAPITGLEFNTTYHYRIKAINSLGATYSNDITFKTFGQVPTVSILTATNIISTGASINGNVNANYLSTVVTFEYGTTASYGNTIPAIQSPVTGNTNTPVNAFITGLEFSTEYHYRLAAVNFLGTTYSNDIQFTTAPLFVIGEKINGGIIFYIDGTGKHGLVCATKDQSTGIKWLNLSYQTTGATATAIGTGQANTTTIVSVQGAGSYAAQLCNDLDLNGYTDWFLPSIDELSLMYTNLNSHYGLFTSDGYWSSSEVSRQGALALDFGGIQAGIKRSRPKEWSLAGVGVRAIRAF